MRPRAISGALALALVLAAPGLPAWTSNPAQARPAQAAGDATAPEAQRELQFLRGLRERGYFDLALEATEAIQKDPKTSPDLKAVLDYEVGRGLLEEATRSADLEKRFALLEQARARLDGFTKANPKHPLAPEALVQLARLYVERGHTSALQADEAKTPADKEAKLVAARAAFAEARKAYEAAEGPIKAAYEAFPKFIPAGDPRREARDRAHTALMEDQLQRAIVDYEEAQTYPLGSDPRNALLDKALAAFKELHSRYRTQLAGLHARMLQGKSYEEKGDLGAAMGIYNELMEHSDRNLRELQRQVGYYRIIVLGKRNEIALAADEAVRWLQANPNARISEIGLGVQLELARNLIAQLPSAGSDRERDEATRKAVERLAEVVRYYSPHKPEALALLQKVQPRAARKANTLANLSFDDAMSQADTALNTEDWSQAIALLNQAVRAGEKAREIDKVNRARYFLAYAHYRADDYYEAATLADHLVRHYPQGGLSPRAADIGMAALTMAYNTYIQVDRLSDLDRLIELARTTAETWPDTEQGDAARQTLGEAALGRGQYAEAAQWLEAVRPESSKKLDCQVKAGDAHWRLAQQLRDKGNTAEADAEAKVALERISDALKQREAANIPLSDPGRITNANALAEIQRASGRPAEAIALLEPIAQAFTASKPSEAVVPLYAATLSTLVRSQLAVGKPDQAIGSMKVLEAVSPSPAALTQLYFELGRSLKGELETLERKGDTAGVQRTQDAYRQFLQALAGSQAGQSFDSLQWAGESMLELGMPKEAQGVLQRVLDTYSKDSTFLQSEGAANRLLRTRLKLISAHRQAGDFDAASALLEPLLKENPSLLEPLIEKGLLLEARAKAQSTPAHWQASRDYWNKLGLRLRQARKRPNEYYEAWYHVAVALQSLGQKQEAAATLKGVITLNPSVGTPALKARYQDLLKQLGG